MYDTIIEAYITGCSFIKENALGGGSNKDDV